MVQGLHEVSFDEAGDVALRKPLQTCNLSQGVFTTVYNV